MYLRVCHVYPLASNKVALLIGIEEYKDKDLPAARRDVITFKRILEKQDFRVTALLNLHRHEILNAVDEFCKDLTRGVYGSYLHRHNFGKCGGPLLKSECCPSQCVYIIIVL